MKKLLSMFVIVTLLVSVFTVSPVYAAVSNVNLNQADTGSGTSSTTSSSTTTDSSIKGSQIIGSIEDEMKKPGSNIDTGKFPQIAAKVIKAIQFASVIATIILIAVFGFQFIMGSAEEKKDYQKKFIPLIVGIVVVFSAATIANLLIDTFTM